VVGLPAVEVAPAWRQRTARISRSKVAM